MGHHYFRMQEIKRGIFELLKETLPFDTLSLFSQHSM